MKLASRWVTIAHQSALSARLWFSSWEGTVPINKCICLNYPWIATSNWRPLRTNTSIDQHTPRKQYFTGDGKLTKNRKINQGELFLPSLDVQAHKCLGSESLTLLCFNVCFENPHIRNFYGYHANVPLVGFSKTIGPLQTQSKLCLPFSVAQAHKYLGSDALSLTSFNVCIKTLCVGMFWGSHAMTTLVGFRKTIGQSRT